MSQLEIGLIVCGLLLLFKGPVYLRFYLEDKIEYDI